VKEVWCVKHYITRSLGNYGVVAFHGSKSELKLLACYSSIGCARLYYRSVNNDILWILDIKYDVTHAFIVSTTTTRNKVTTENSHTNIYCKEEK
jgi:hypothetical protein